MFKSRCFWIEAVALLALAASANAAVPGAIDRGPLDALEPGTPISITIALSLPHRSEAEQLQQAIYTPGTPQFHHFLTASEFATRFAPSKADIASIAAVLAQYGLTTEKTTATTLKVTGLPAQLEQAFSVSLHRFEVAAHDNLPAYTYRAPMSRPIIPTGIASEVAAIVGLDSRPVAQPHLQTTSPFAGIALRANSSGDSFGTLTVSDFAAHYDVDPLYQQGVTGRGRTIGIMTLAAFTPDDAYKYWEAVGLTVASDRIRIMNVDGGPGAPSDASGSMETTLDVEQSGGVAPGASIIVYQAPNTNQGFVDVFATAIDANSADSLSTSWGDWEWFENLENSPVTDPVTGKTAASYAAIHELLLRAAIQGQAAFAAAGDGGAYDINNDLACNPPYSPSSPDSCSATLAVDYPASDPLITAGGGTTLPGLQQYCLNAACTSIYSVDVPHERVWGWDYLEGLCAALGTPNPVTCGIWGGGGGGGVSISFPLPSYQSGLFGTQSSQPGQAFYAGTDVAAEIDLPPGLVYALPAFYPGRNLPDVSFNADPDTGYEIYYTSSVTGFGINTFWGGTSFVAPQLNGVTALLGQYLNQRVGLLNEPLYSLAVTRQAYGGADAPLHAIAYGDNWFYSGSDGYNLGAGLGTLDVAAFAELLRRQF
jgi:kumamolisin